MTIVGIWTNTIVLWWLENKNYRSFETYNQEGKMYTFIISVPFETSFLNKCF